MPYQVAVQGQHVAPRTVALRPGSNLVGRAGRSDILLSGPLVSRTHAKIVIEHDGGVNVYDLDSHNGTFVNGEKIRSRLVQAGDHIYVGGFRLTLEASDQAAAPTAGEGLAALKLSEKIFCLLSAARSGEAVALLGKEQPSRHLAVLARTVDSLAGTGRASQFTDQMMRALRETTGASLAVLVDIQGDELGVRSVMPEPTGEAPVARELLLRAARESTVFFSRERAAGRELMNVSGVPDPAAILVLPLLAEAGKSAPALVQLIRAFTPGGFTDAEVEAGLMLSHLLAQRPLSSIREAGEEAITDTHTTPADIAAIAGGLQREDVRAALLKVVPEELADRVMQAATGQASDAAPITAGEQVVVFYDLHGFDGWASTQSADDVARIVGGVSGAAASVASAFGGRLDQTMGAGGFLRFWDGSLGESGEAALRAALDLRSRVSSLLGEHGKALKLRAGVDAGTVLAGVFGDGARATYTLVGSPARVAERIAEMAGHGEVYITASVRGALVSRSGWRFIALGPHALRGRSEAVDLFRVDGAPAGSG